MRESLEIPALRDEVISFCARATGRSLERSAATGAKDFAALGVDSVSVFQLQMQLEDRFELTLPETFLFEHPTPERAAAALLVRLQASPVDA